MYVNTINVYNYHNMQKESLTGFHGIKEVALHVFFADALQWETMSSDTQEKVQTGATRDETWKIFFQSCYYKFELKT